MSENKNIKASTKQGSGNPDELDELNMFIEKKKIQNKALKKIIDRLNSTETQNNDHK